jgi:glucose-1-phosphate adenylyltransferase
VEALVEDARRSTDHDFGRTIIPEYVAHLNVYTYNFLDNAVPGIRPYEERGYWRDVGTITAYWQAHMDLLGRQPLLNLDNERWPIVAASYQGPSARIIEGDVTDSLIGEGSVIDEAVIRRSILGRSVRVERGAVVEESVVMDHTVVGQGARLRRVIADRYNLVPAGARIGGNSDADRLRYHLDPSGLVVLPRGQTR